jgi:predicted anti-sigma-YlaC factor YlaD
MISCRHAAELTSLQLDTDLTLGQKVVLGVHRVICGACRRFGQQLLNVNDATTTFLQHEPQDDRLMPNDARSRIEANLDAAKQAE